MGKVKKSGISFEIELYNQIEEFAIKHYDGNISKAVNRILSSYFYRTQKVHQLDPHLKRIDSFLNGPVVSTD